MTTGKLKSALWKIVTMPIMGVIYCAVISDGLRSLVPVLGQKLHKLPLPWFSELRDYEATYRLDLANFLSIFLMVAVWYLWTQVLRMWLGRRDAFYRSGWNPEAYQIVVSVLAFVILGADAALFYIAMTQMGWNEADFSLSALLATAAYLAVIVFVSFVSVNLETPFKED